MGYWMKHPKPDGEATLRILHQHGWRIDRGKGYYICYCPCGQHHKSVHLTPSNRNHFKRVIGKVEKLPCWSSPEDEEASR